MIFVPSFSAVERKAQNKGGNTINQNQSNSSDSKRHWCVFAIYHILSCSQRFQWILFPSISVSSLQTLLRFSLLWQVLHFIDWREFVWTRTYKMGFFSVTHQLHQAFCIVVPFNLFPSFSYCKQSYISLHRLQAHTQLLQVEGGVVVICLFLQYFHEDKIFQTMFFFYMKHFYSFSSVERKHNDWHI